MPLTTDGEDAPDQLRSAILDRSGRSVREPKIYPDREALIATRLRGPTPLSALSAEDIVARGAERVEDGWRWRSDGRLKLASELRLTPELVRAFVARIDCPILLLLADRTRLERFQGMEAHARRLDLVEVPGSHHFHMEEPVSEVAERLWAFFAR